MYEFKFAINDRVFKVKKIDFIEGIVEFDQNGFISIANICDGKLLRCIGLKDKNNDFIYEGDFLIVICDDNDLIYEVFYEESIFGFNIRLATDYSEIYNLEEGGDFEPSDGKLIAGVGMDKLNIPNSGVAFIIGNKYSHNIKEEVIDGEDYLLIEKKEVVK